MILELKLKDKIKKKEEELRDSGELLSADQIDKNLKAFQDKFYPDKLKNLDGEMLLDTMLHISNKESLTYWLEFKNDDEFQSPKFGTIGGGSSLVYGAYKRAATDTWMKGSPSNQIEISIPEAIDIAKRNRDQLVKGFEHLKELSEQPSEKEYIELQDKMNNDAHDVSNSSWGHKYFYLFFPDKIDNFHSPYYQRFYLIKLLKVPPDIEGRYVCAWHYVTIAKELNMPMVRLTRILNTLYGRPHNYWRIGTRLDGTKSIWNLMKEDKCIAVGWDKVPDLSDIEYKTEDKEKIRSYVSQGYSETPQQTGRSTQQLFYFKTVIKENDLVIASHGDMILGIGRVVGDYYYVEDSEAPHRRKVQWLSYDEWKIPERERQQITISELKKPVNLVEFEKKLLVDAIDLPPVPIGFTGIIGRIQSILERKNQVILYGPPGTGKTYWAEKAADELAADAHFHKRFDDLGEDEKKFIRGGSSQSGGLVRMCSFHPAYGYEDFIEGYRPRETDQKLIFKLENGIFKKLCLDAKDNPTDKYYLIIDEINRGDIPRIFGELMTVIEKDKRGKDIMLAVSGEIFSIPSNVFIIGTMNTADRSIALLDTALRRRFGFIELMPDIDVLGNTAVEDIVLGPWLKALNKKIRDNIGRDARNLQIGHAYFLEKDKAVTSLDKLKRIIQDDVIPLLEEYCYEDYDALDKILGSSLVDKLEQRIKFELFEKDREEDLILALKIIDPNLAIAEQTIKADAEKSITDEESRKEEEEEGDESGGEGDKS